jgi:cobalt-zinc-cadmium efflux system protein
MTPPQTQHPNPHPPPKSHHHGHEHHNHGHHTPKNFDRAFAIGISVNILFVLIEGFYGWKVNSLALLADAAHNLCDVAGLVMAWAGTLAGKLPSNARYTYGWKRASIFAAFANAVVLLLAMGSLMWEAIKRLQTPELTQSLTVMAAAGIGIFVNLGTALLFIRGREHDLNIQGAYLHMASDALVSAGVVLAGGLLLWTGWAWLDPVASMVIALFIVVGTWGLFRQSLRLMFDGVPHHIDLIALHNTLKALPGVAHVHNLHVWAVSTSEAALTAHLVMPAGQPEDAFFETTALKLRDEFKIKHVTLQVMRAPLKACHGSV